MYTCTHTLAALYCNPVEEYKHVQKGLYASTGLYNMLRKWYMIILKIVASFDSRK